jgi:hypothetical protein
VTLKRVSYLLVVLLQAEICLATTGVVLYVKDFAVVATDGRVNEVGGVISGHTTECKLDVVNSKVAIVAGLAKEQDVGFDARQILRDAMQQSNSVDEAANYAQRQIQRKLPAAAQAFKQHNPDRPQDWSDLGLQFVVVGVDETGAVRVARSFISADPSKLPQADDATGTDDHVGIAVIGESNAINRDLDRLHNANGWVGKDNPNDLEKMARRFIALEIVEQPHRVGPPLAVVLLDRNGVHGVEDGACRP